MAAIMMSRRLTQAIANAGMSGFLIKLEYVKVIHQRCARRFLYYLLPLLLVLTALRPAEPPATDDFANCCSASRQPSTLYPGVPAGGG